MADIFTIVEGILAKITDLKAIESAVYFLSNGWIFLLPFVVILGLAVLIWVIRGVRNDFS